MQIYYMKRKIRMNDIVWVKIRVFFPLQNPLFYALFSTFERKNGTLIMTYIHTHTVYIYTERERERVRIHSIAPTGHHEERSQVEENNRQKPYILQPKIFEY